MAAVTRIFVVAIVLGIVLVPGAAAAQTIQGGIQGGVTFSTLTNLDSVGDVGAPLDVGHRTGVVIGPFVTFPITRIVALQLEALYAMKGATTTVGTNVTKARLGYLDFPVLIRLATSSTERVYFVFGPSLNINLSAQTIDEPPGTSLDVKDQTRDNEFGLVLGAGVTFKPFLVEGRYSAGLTNVADAPQLRESIRNRSFSMLVGVRF